MQTNSNKEKNNKFNLIFSLGRSLKSLPIESNVSARSPTGELNF